MFWISKIFLKEINTFIQQGHIKLNKNDSKDKKTVTKTKQKRKIK